MHERVDRLLHGPLAVARELEQEFDALLVESSRLAFRVAYSVLRQRQDAEDVAQEAFVRAHRRFRQLRDRQRFRAWLVRMTWRLALDRQRTDKRRAARERAHPIVDANTNPLRQAGASERAARLWAAIDALPEKLRIALVLSSIEGYDVAEVAGLLGIPQGTVKSRLFLARKRLKEQLQ
jgi:RNA polymerase sigma-70 factor (ECF subfamily)